MIHSWLLASLILPGGFLLDALTGDPPWFPHPVRGMGFVISRGEGALRKLLPTRERLAGTILVILTASISFIVPFALMRAADFWSPWAAFVLGLLLADSALAVRQLAIEAARVYQKTRVEDLEGARYAVSMIVGRDPERLSLEGVNKAAVETVAESLCDGVIAPMFFLALGGVPLAFAFKAVSAMDSMIGYKNEKYLYFGRTAAKLDDALNFLPARISGILIVLAAGILRLNFRNAWKILRRDRFNHASPNSAHPEAAIAGALGVALAGNAYYQGKLEEKPLIGDPLRDIESEDIKRAIAIMYTASLLFLPIAWVIRAAVCYGASLLFG